MFAKKKYLYTYSVYYMYVSLQCRSDFSLYNRELLMSMYCMNSVWHVKIICECIATVYWSSEAHSARFFHNVLN